MMSSGLRRTATSLLIVICLAALSVPSMAAEPASDGGNPLIELWTDAMASIIEFASVMIDPSGSEGYCDENPDDPGCQD